MTYRGKSGKIYETLEPPIGSGGEGKVYRINGHPGEVLKVLYPDKRDEKRHRKLLAMLASPLSDDALSQVSWPSDVIYENSAFSGYIMPLVNNQESLSAVCSGHHTLNFRDRAGIAKNLCSAVNAVHQAGQVCGDLNPNNITVDSKSGLVTLVDTDSYHITDPSDHSLYRCTVGMPEYIPAELQKKITGGMTLETAPLPTFTRETDLFALAVHIFQLLMNGCHPYACAVDPKASGGAPLASLTAPQPVENIRKGYFPFYSRGSGLTLPKYAPSLSILPPALCGLFIRAFIEGNNDPSRRPDAVEWFQALTKLQSDLKVCRAHPDHIYPGHLSDCPWCALEAKLHRQPARAQVKLSQTPVISNNTQVSGSSHTKGTNHVSQPRVSQPRPARPKGKNRLLACALAVMLICAFCQSKGYLNNLNISMAAPNEKSQGSAGNNKSGAPAKTYDEIYIPMISPGLTVITDSMTEDGEEHFYPVHIERDGRYRFEIQDMKSGKVMMSLYDQDGTAVEEDKCCSDKEGITAKALKVGTDYELKLTQYEGYVDYALLIGVQKETTDTADNAILHDHMEYTDQRNMYSLTPETSGTITVTVYGMDPEMRIELCAFDENKECIISDTCSNGDSIIIRGLTPETGCMLQARQCSRTGAYSLKIDGPA